MEEETIQKLIQCVENEKVLYDKHNPFYFNKQKRDRIWQQIGKECGMSDVECKHRWKLLRERFVKEKKKRGTRSGTGLEAEGEWQFCKAMEFLEDSITPRRARYDHKDIEFTAVEGGESNSSPFLEENNLEDSTPETFSSQNIKRKRQSVEENFDNIIQTIPNNFMVEPKETTTDEVFMQMVLHLMADLPLEVKDKFQLEVFQKLYQLRAENRNK